MTTHEAVFLSLLRNSLWDTRVEVPDDFQDWGLVMRLAKSQAMEGAVAKGLLDSPDVLGRMRPESKARLNNMLMTNVVMHSMANSSVQIVVSALRDAGIGCVLLKGQGLAANYKHPEIRDCGDIDLYVGVENYRRSYEVLKEVADTIDESSVLDGKGKHYHAMLSGISVEVHKYSEEYSLSSANRIYQAYASEGLSQNLVGLDFGDAKVMTPADDFNAFYIFSHLWNHFLSVGVGLRQICDWTMFLHQRGNNVDKEYLRRVLTDMKLMIPWKVIGCISVDILGLPSEVFPFYEAKYRKMACKVLQRIMVVGDMGRETEFVRTYDRGYLYEKLISLNCYVKRFNSLVLLFPRHAFVQLWLAVTSGVRRIFTKI